MGVTISTHNGSVAHRSHNIREPRTVDKQEHIDPNGIHEVWRDEPPKEAYHRLFDKSVKAYNDKQTRSDRKIDDYYKQVYNSKTQHPVYEMIVAVGNKEHPVPSDTAKSILKEYYEGWDKANPNMILIGAYYHADEQGVPHVHIDYVPVAHGYTRGMETRTGLDKALREQGYTKRGRETPQIQWQRAENARLERLCREREIEVEHPSKAQEKALEHKETRLYQREQDIIKVDKAITAKEKEITAKAQSIEDKERAVNERLRRADERLQGNAREILINDRLDQQETAFLQGFYTFLQNHCDISDYRALQRYAAKLLEYKNNYERDHQQQQEHKHNRSIDRER